MPRQLPCHLALDHIKDEWGMRRIAGHADHLGPCRGKLSDACDDTAARIGRISGRIGADLGRRARRGCRLVRSSISRGLLTRNTSRCSWSRWASVLSKIFLARSSPA